MDGIGSYQKHTALWTTLGIAATLLVFASCGLVSRHARSVAQQHWRRDQGPVVPHDTFPKDCSLCHEQGSWHKIRDDFQFDHAKETGLALFGAHGRAQCLRCHNDRGPVAVFAKKGCAGCHVDYHRGQLGSQCQQCHNECNWIPGGQFALHNRTRFPLVGAHTAVACFRCHPGAQVGNFIRAPVACEACHQQDLQRTRNPNHIAQGWTQDCDRCHQPIAWQSAVFNHSQFPLLGAHRTVNCSHCHANGVFTGLSHDCASCHLADFRSTTRPNHVASGFPMQCQLCHNVVAWQGAVFDHAGVTSNCVVCHLPEFNHTRHPNHVAAGFPTNCETCHTSTMSWTPASFNHAGITSNCQNCHLPQYNAAANPNHVALNFPRNCEACHQTQAWRPATFDHTGIVHNCVRCHQAEYNATTSPNHAARGFPTNCEICHNTLQWQGAVFNHTFRITSGPHRSLSCAECHQSPANYATVSCVHCHSHGQAIMGDRHKDVPGYSWTNSACVSCHPTGR